MAYVGSRKAPTWRHFKDTDPPQKDRAQCKYCPKTVSCKNGGTTNPMSHLRSHHPFQYMEVVEHRGVKRSHQEKEQDSEVGNVSEEISSSKSEFVPQPRNLPEERAFSALSSSNDSGMASADMVMGSPFTSTAFSKARGNADQSKLESFKPLEGMQLNKCHMCAAYYIITCMRPLNTVEKKGFRVLCKGLNPSYELMSRRTLRDSYLPLIYHATKESVQIVTKTAQYFALTIDIWTNDARVSFISLAAHFADSDWNLVEATLNCKYLSNDQNAQVIKQAIEEIFEEWNLNFNDMSGVTSGNEENVRAAIEQLEGPVNHVGCFGHTMDNDVKSTVTKCKVLADAINKAHSVRNFFSQDEFWRHYSRHVNSRYHKSPLKMPAPCKTRWWVDLQLAEAVVSQYSWQLDFLASYDSGKYLSELPSQNVISVLKCYVRALKPIEAISTFMCGKKYVASSAILPMLYLLDPESSFYGGDDLALCGRNDTSVDAASPSQHPDLEEKTGEYDEIPLSNDPKLRPKSLQAGVIEKLKKRYCPVLPPDPSDLRAMNEYRRGVSCHEVLVRCSYLDPRFRSSINEDDRDIARQNLIAELETHDALYGGVGDEVQRRPQGEAAGPILALAKLFHRKSQAVTANGDAGDCGPTLRQRFKQEVVRYELLPPADLTEDPFLWWKDHQAALPVHAKMARKYLVITATSVPSDSLFSRGGDIHIDTRNSVSGKNAEMLIFCAANEGYIPVPE